MWTPFYPPPLIPFKKSCCIRFRSFAWKTATFTRCDNCTNCEEPLGSKHVVVLEDAAARAIVVLEDAAARAIVIVVLHVLRKRDGYGLGPGRWLQQEADQRFPNMGVFYDIRGTLLGSWLEGAPTIW